MTDHHAGYVVALDHNIREDDAQAVLAALSMVKGVIGVEPVEADLSLQVAQMRADSEIRTRLWNALKD
jgi:hypothetical protein